MQRSQEATIGNKNSSGAHETSAIASVYDPKARAVVFKGDNRKFLASLPEKSVDLIVTSPPYNLGKSYETRTDLDSYLQMQRAVVVAAERVLSAQGSICWQVGNWVDNGRIVPLDILLYPVFDELGLVLRNRIIWSFGHGLHSKRRFSGRYETVLWFTRDTDDYYFNLDAVRVPQKYPGKRHYKGPKTGEYSGHPIGKNPSDVWEIPNVKSNHVEKTEHQCQFPIALVQRLVRALTPPDGTVLDPYLGVGSAACAAVLEGRKGLGSELDPVYAAIARERVADAIAGNLRYRPLEKPIYAPPKGTPLTTRSDRVESTPEESDTK